MTAFQRIVKYFAIGLAALLSLSICTGILAAGLGLVSATRLIKDNSSVSISCEEDIETPCLEIALSVSKLEIKPGNAFYAETENDHIDIVRNDHRLVLKERGKRIFSENRLVTVYVPDNMTFEKVAISSGIGSINIESLRAKTLELALGIGETTIKNLDVDTAKVNSGIGAVHINLPLPESAYEIKVEKGLGDIKLNGNSIKSSTFGSGAKKISLETGIGSLDLTTK